MTIYLPYINDNNEYNPISAKSIVNEDGTNEITADKIGDLTNIESEYKDSIVSALNDTIERLNISNLTISDILNRLNPLEDDVGDISELTTDEKDSLVGAINEINSKQSGTAGVTINDTTPSASTTYSSIKIEDKFTNLLNDINTKLAVINDRLISAGA